MAAKQVEVPEVGTLFLYKRRGTTHIRLSVTANGQIRVTMPLWLPYKAGIEFAKIKADWIREQHRPEPLIEEGHKVGKAHHIVFVPTDGTRVSSRIRGNEIRISVPKDESYQHPAIQAAARRAGLKALKVEAAQLLPQRLATLAQEHGFLYKSLSIKPMKGRWGSCSQDKDIVLNCYLMQLPWHLIDYVIMHELAHTRIMAHGAAFWEEVGRYVPHLPAVRKQMRTYQPAL